MRIKVISILSILPVIPDKFYKDPTDYSNSVNPCEILSIYRFPFVIGFFKADFHHKSALEIKKRTQVFDIECWRIYGDQIDTVYEKNVDGIIHKVFPSKRLRIRGLGSIDISVFLLNELRNEIRKGKVMLYFHGSHKRFVTWILLKLKPFDIPVIVQHRGGALGIQLYKNNTGFGKFNIIPLVDYYFQKKTFRYIDHYFSGSVIDMDYIGNTIGFANISYLKDGVDFSVFKPDIPNKNKLRQKLNLPEDKTILLYVGRFTKTKNVDILINAYLSLKKQKFFLVLIGGYKSDEYYEYSFKNNIYIRERIPESDLIAYYQASDIYILPIVNKNIIDFAGFGTAPIQALACGLPVIFNNIIHFPGSREEREKIGLPMPSLEILKKNILYIKDNIGQFKDCRIIAQKYFDINITTGEILKVMNELKDKYYS